MNALESVRIALRALRVNKLRSTLTMLGIIIGVAAVVTMVAMGQGAQTQVAEQIRSLGANLLMIMPGTAREGGVRLESGTRRNLTESDAAAIAAEVAGIEVAVPAVRGRAQIVHANRNWNTTVNGTRPDYFLAREWAAGAGRLFTGEEVTTAAKVALIGATVAEALFENADPVDRTIRIANVPFAVVGVLSEKGPSGSGRDQDDVVFLPISTAKLRLQLGSTVDRDAVDYILVKAASVDAMGPAETGVRGLLRQRHRLRADAEDDFQIYDPAAQMQAYQEATRTFTLLLASIASVSLLVGGISIMNIMLVSVTERTREIGLRLAVGARGRDIRNQFLIESVTLCLAGGLAGIVLGVGGAVAVAELAGWAVFVGPGAVLFAVAFAAAVGIFFGLYPAIKAARLDPITALRFE